MAAIDLIVLGVLKKAPMSAYDIQKVVDYRHISRWVKISTPSIYKKTIQLEKKGLIEGTVVQGGKHSEKVVYALTPDGEAAFERLMLEIAASPIHFFLDFNAVVVNLESLPVEKRRRCLDEIERNMTVLKAELEENLREKEGAEDVPALGMAVLRQQLALAEAVEEWLGSLKETLA